MERFRIPTIIGLLIIFLGTAAGLFLLGKKQVIKIGASAEEAPKDVRITNITDSTITITWRTDKKTSGLVKYGEDSNSLNNVQDDQTKELSNTHFVIIKNLTEEKEYYFKILSNENLYDNEGSPWKIKTGKRLPLPINNYVISGSILDKEGKPVKNALVFVTPQGGETLSTITSENGTWVIDIKSARSINSNSFIDLDPNETEVELLIQGEKESDKAFAIFFPSQAKPLPPLIFGESKDFRKDTLLQKEGEIPELNINLPTQEKKEPKFPNETPPQQTVKEVRLESIKEGEIVNNTKPEFFGEGPANQTITITVQSETITETIKVKKDGTWTWSPPKDLSEGTHTITISWKDENGILRTLTKNFVVQAAEGPAFVSSPSASLTPSPSPSPSLSPSPVASSTPKITPSPSASPLPETGILTPTIGLSIMGLGLLGLSFLSILLF